VPAGLLTHTLHWQPGIASFKTTMGPGEASRSKRIAEHVFTSGVPAAAAETVHIELYEFHHSKNISQLPAEVVIQKFEYLP